MEEFPCEAYYHRIGRNIRRLRRKKGMTQEVFAEAARMEKRPICIMQGKSIHLPQCISEREEVFVRDIGKHTMIGYKYFQFKGEHRLTVVTRGAEDMLLVKDGMGEGMQEVAKISLKKEEYWHRRVPIVLSAGIFVFANSCSVEFPSCDFSLCRVSLYPLVQMVLFYLKIFWQVILLSVDIP